MVEFGRQRPPEPTWKATLWCRCGMVCIWQLTFCIRSKTSAPWKLPSRCSSSGHLTTSPPNPEWKRPATSLVRATCQLFRTAGGGMPPRVGSRNTWMKETTVTTPSNGWPGSPGATARLECMGFHTQRIPRQAALACLDPPHLACMWLDCGGFSNAFISGCRNGGAFELRQVTWAYREAVECPEVNRDSVKKRALQEQNIHDWFQRLPWKAGQSPLSCCPDYESYLLEIWGHETFDEYWRQVGLCAEAHYSQLADVPQVHLGGWYDTYSMSTPTITPLCRR